MNEIELPTFKCMRCNHEWVPRTARPVQCPICRSRNWAKKRKPKPTKEEKKVTDIVPNAFR